MPDKIQDLSHLSLFGALSEDAIGFLYERSERLEVDAGDKFFDQGDSADAVYALLHGRVEIEKTIDDHCLQLCELGSGSCFGELALVAISRRTATVRALTRCTALKIQNLSILALYEHDLEQFTLLQMNLSREIARRLTIADETLCRQMRSMPSTERADGVAREQNRE